MTTKDGPKLPKQQLAILAIARVAEPMAYTSVFPYLPAMVSSFGVPTNKVGSWVGVTSGVFSISQSITAVAWGRASDAYGRKPTIILGLISTMVCFIIWGMSTSLPMAIAVRAIQGGGNGNVGIIRTMVAEMVPERELQPRAFSIMPVVWSIGSIIGPSFGGFFAEPAEQYPEIFGHMEFFKKFPFILPNLILTIFFCISVTVAVLFLHETLPSKKGHRDWGLLVGERIARSFKNTRPTPSTRRPSFVDGEATSPLLPNKTAPKKQAEEPPKRERVLTRQTCINLLAYTFLAFHSVAYDQILSVFLRHPVEKHTPENTAFPFYFSGGFGMSHSQVGLIYTVYGVVCGAIQFLLYPTIVARYGVLRCFRICCLLMPLAYFLTPYCVLFPTHNSRTAALIAVMFIKAAGIIVAFPSTTILLTNSCTSLRVLGTLNGYATTFSGLGRAVGPASTGALFTWGADHGYVVTAWFFLMFVAILGAVPAYLVEEGAGPTASASTSVENSDTEDNEVSSSSSTLLLPEGSAVASDSEDEQPLNKARPEGTYGTIQGGRN
ncbi:major facilitator superfamily domain-containing protein [Fusarium flagelliforme]|uniref:major facilitator superfamily domain-containing protein n=1 Tax=Fusarium flagelliforme TaxID=2675880 RepID=UPI001E8CC57D|nr:major facilitator superfamily domain-containing protein [Fusarium flagelliforme]KAH7197263.1 major facilitator superfamily domain-containing protein [Fusarium flagelliforme]